MVHSLAQRAQNRAGGGGGHPIGSDVLFAVIRTCDGGGHIHVMSTVMGILAAAADILGRVLLEQCRLDELSLFHGMCRVVALDLGLWRLYLRTSARISCP